MLEMTLYIKPLTVNRAWRGRRFSTAAKTEYETRLRFSLPKVAVVGKPYYKVAYDFHLINFSRTDGANLEKVLTDCLVKRGIIKDDRYIVEYCIRKFPAKKDRIVIRIEPAGPPEGD